MNQANVSKLVSKLRFNYQPKARKLRNVDGSEGRIRKIQKSLTALIKYERLEMNYQRADEVRGYVDRLISEAIRHGPANKETMDLADFWIQEKQLVHKLFKVLVPRYQEYTTSYTKLHKGPDAYPVSTAPRAILELRGNIFPSIDSANPHEQSLLHNVLLDEARKEFRMAKYRALVENIAKDNDAENR